MASFGPPLASPSRTTSWAPAALVLAVLVAPVGLVLGVVARGRSTAGTTSRTVSTVAIGVGAVLTAVIAAAAVMVLAFPDQLSRMLTPQLSATAVAGSIETTSRYPAGTVTCPESVPATPGASTVCTAKAPGAPPRLRATVSTVEGGRVIFDVVPG